MEMGTLNWPQSDLASLLPLPASTIGKVTSDSSSGCYIYVGDTSRDDFNAYVEACQTKGFTVDYNKGDDYYYADDINGNHLSLSYEGNNVMSIQLRQPTETTSSEDNESTSNNQSTTVPSNPETSESQTLVDGMRPEFNTAQFILEDGKYICGWAVEKMSKSMFNVVNPDDIVERYGADTLRLYEMFLGPLEQSKPWDTNGIDGVHRFLKKLWNLFFDNNNLAVKNNEPTKEELKSLHKLIKKVSWDIENFSFNTSISAFMICVNELSTLKSRNKHVLENLLILLTPFAPHISEELWHQIGNVSTICDAQWPILNENYLKEISVNYAISFNGKARFNLEFSTSASKEDIEKEVLNHPLSAKWIDGKTPKKIIIVPNKIVNIVL